jgi:hypothetical protein
VFCSLDEPTAALKKWIKIWNANRPFRWTKTADQIIHRICRYCSRVPEPASGAARNCLARRAPLPPAGPGHSEMQLVVLDAVNEIIPESAPVTRPERGMPGRRATNWS